NDDQTATKAVGERQDVGHGRTGKIDHLEQQHHGGGIADQIRKRCRRQSQIDRGIEIKSALRQPVNGLVAVTGGLKRSGDHKQSDEQRQNRPFHQTEQILSAKFGAGQMDAGGGQDDHFFWNGGEEKPDDHDENNDSLDRKSTRLNSSH